MINIFNGKLLFDLMINITYLIDDSNVMGKKRYGNFILEIY